MKKFKTLCSLLLIVAMCASLFAGCSLFDKSPKTAEELLAKSKEAMAAVGQNMNIVMDMDLGVEIEIEQDGAELSMSMPIELKADMSFTDKYACGKTEADGEVKITIQYDGEKETQTEEMSSVTKTYIVFDKDEVTTYTKEDDGDWTYVVEDKDDSFSASELWSDEIFANAEFTRDKDADCYYLKAKLSELFKNKKLQDLMEDSEDVDLETLQDAVGDATVTYKFDKDFRIVGASVDKITLNAKDLIEDGDFGDMGLGELDEDDIEITMQFEIKLSKFGEIKDDDVKVTNKVKEEAIEEDDWTDDDLDEDEDDWDDDNDKKPSDDKPVESKPSEDDDKDVAVSDGVMSDDWSKLDIKIDGVVYHFPYDYDLLLANGWYIDLKENDWEDGYVLNKGDSVSGTVDMYNKKYGQGWDYFSAWVGFKNYDSKVKDITECDLWSIELDIMDGSKTYEKYPEIELAKGITWGATAEQIKTAYGEWEDSYESEEFGYMTVDYNVDYDIYMSLTIDDKLGLTAVELQSYE